ncbi:hypothetical protein PENTCL1PPCAC_23716, partial [Pristionchus entomophagus]
AIFQLQDAIPFDKTASPICLPSCETTIPEDGQVIATGFGTRFYDGTKIIEDIHICGGSFGHGTARGDSGGPLVMFSKGERWFQV